MEYMIKLKPEELTHQIVDQIKKLLPNGKTFEITVIVKEKLSSDYLLQEPEAEYGSKLDRLIEEAENTRNFISFTPEEFERFSEAMELKNSLSKK